MSTDVDEAQGGAVAVAVYVAKKEQPLRQKKNMSSNQIGTLAVGTPFVVLERDKDKKGPLLHVGPAPDGPDVSGWIRKSDGRGHLLIKAVGEGEAAPSAEELLAEVEVEAQADAAGTGTEDPAQKAKKKEKTKQKETEKGKGAKRALKSASIDVRAEVEAEAEMTAIRQRAAEKDEQDRQREIAAATIARVTQSLHRGNVDREALGVQEAKSGQDSPVEKLHRFESAKLMVFVVANCCTGLFGALCAYTIYTLRLSDSHVNFASGGSNTSAQLMFMIVFGLFLCSIIGIYGAVKTKLAILRFYAFFLMLLICAQLSTLMVLLLEVNSGATSQVETTASEQLKLDTATTIREQYCIGKEYFNRINDFLGDNSTDANAQASCQGRHQTNIDGEDTGAFKVRCPGLPQNGTCTGGSGPGTCTGCGYDQGCGPVNYYNGEQPGCAAVGLVDCGPIEDGGGGCVPAFEVSDDYCAQTYRQELARANTLAFAQTAQDAEEEVDNTESMCPSECKYRARQYTDEEFNNTQIRSQLDWSTFIWGQDSHDMCECDPEQDTEAKKERFLSCMHAFYLKNMGYVILIIGGTILAEISLGVFGWTVLRPWAKRRLEKLSARPNSYNKRSKNWSIVAAFTLPETEEDIVRKEMVIVTETWYFEGTVVGVVVLSMYVLAMTSPTVPPPEDDVLTLRMLEVFVTVFLSMELGLEMVVTLSARRHEVYFKNPWHWVDYFVLVVSWMFLLDPENQFTAVCRALRVVRPMRSISLFSSFKLIGDCLSDDADIFFDVTAFTLLMILTFSLVGLTSYHGALQYTCGVPINPSCPHELDGVCGTNDTWVRGPGEVVDLRTPREAWAQETNGVDVNPSDTSEEGSVTQRLIDEGNLHVHPMLDNYLLTGIHSVELPSVDLLEYVYGDSSEDHRPLDGIPCPSTLNCGAVKDKDNPGWWQTPLFNQDEPMSRCYKLNPPRILTEDDSGRRGFDDMSQGFITFLVSMSGDGGMEQVPTGLVNAGATSSYFAWPFFFVVSIVLNFVTLNLLLAMCVATLENVNAEFKKVEKDKAKTLKLQKHGARARKKRMGMSSAGNAFPGPDALNAEVEKRLGKLDDAISGTYDKLLEGFEDFDEQRSAMEEALEKLDWTGKRFGKLRNECKVFILSTWYRNGVVLMILGWTVTLMIKTGATTQADLTEDETKLFIELFNDLELGLLIGFGLEMVVKVLGTGWSLFRQNQESVLDLILFILTCVAFSTSYFGFTIEYACRANEMFALVNGTEVIEVDRLAHEASVATCVEETISRDTRKMFQMLRVAQIARMLYKHESVYTVMRKIFKNWKAILGIFLFVVFSMAMFAIVGMHLLGKGQGYGEPYEGSGLCCTDEEGELYFRSNFETFWDGMLSTVQIILGDDWMLIMLWYMNNSSMTDYSGVTATFFTLAFLFVFGVCFNLFVAVLLINFGVDEDEKMPKQKEKYHRAREQREKLAKRRASKEKEKHSDILAMALQAEAAQVELAEKQKKKSNAISRGEIDLVKVLEADLNPNHKSLNMFRSNSAFRLAAARLETNPWFLRGMLGLIFTSMVVLAMEDEALLEQDEWKTRTRIMEYAVFSYFVAEMILKSVSGGFIFKCGPSKPYLTVQRNRNDFVFVVLAVLIQRPSITTYLEEHGIEDRHLRILRGIGPMVGLLQSQEIRVVTGSFYMCLPGVATVMVPMFFVLLMFALLGFELYHGRLRRCLCPLPNNNVTGGDEVSGLLWCNPEGEAVDCGAGLNYTIEDPCYGYGALSADFIDITNRTGCDLRGYRWDNDPIVGGFDDVLNAAITLFKGSTTGATDLLYVAMDAPPVIDELPGRMQNPSAAIFLTVFHAVFTMFLLNIFIGVMSSTFSIQTGKATETEGQKRWDQLVKDVKRFSPTYSPEEMYRPDEQAKHYELRLKAFNLATHYAFEYLCIAMVLGNTVLLITEHYPASTEYIAYTDTFNLVFISWFALEFVVKLAGFGPQNYFGDGWLVFDFIIIAATWGIRLSSSNATGMDVLKLARCMKIMLLAKRLKTLVDLMYVVAACITKALNVAIIMLVITYVYAIMGMKLYGAATLLPATNFADFPHAMKLLIQVMTGQSYGKITALLMAENYNEQLALMYFVSYYVLSVFICTNLFVVTVLDNFDVASRSGQVIKVDEFWGFTYAWAELSVGAHAVPVLGNSQGLDFVKKLRKVVAKKKEQLDVRTISVKVKNIPTNMARVEILKDRFSKYGEIENVELRHHRPLSGAYVTFQDKDGFKKDECLTDEIYLGTDSEGKDCRLEVAMTRHGDFPHGISVISMPDKKRSDRGTMQINVLRCDGLSHKIQPFIKVTNVAKHLHHGGRHVSKLTRAINRNSIAEDAEGFPSVVVLAPPGAQKYQYCKQIARRYGLMHIDVGEMLRHEEAEQILKYKTGHSDTGKRKPLSPGKPPENWFISQEEEAADKEAQRVAKQEAEESISPNSSGAMTPRRKTRMTRSEKRVSMGIVSPKQRPEDHLKNLVSHAEHHPALHSGKLVGDKHVIPLIRAKIEQAEANNQGFILSGFPRTKRQANQLKAMNAVPAVVVILEVDETDCFRGCRDRRIDPETERVYDLELNPPKSDKVRGRVVCRRDDHDPKIIEKRLQRYAHKNEETLDALGRFVNNDRIYRLTVDNPNETLQDMVGLMEVSFGDATHYNVDASPSAPVPAEWSKDEPLYFEVNEHSNAFSFELFDAANLALKPLATASLGLHEIIEQALIVDDHDIQWNDENLDDLLSIKSLNPLNAMSTVNKTLKEAEKIGQIALQEAKKGAAFAAATAEMALETVAGVESATLESIADDGATTRSIDLKEGDEVVGKIIYQVRFHTKEWVPDWGFISQFGDDNPHLKPGSCGIEGWLEHKQGEKSGAFKSKWVFITQNPPQLCILDVNDEMHLRDVMKGKHGKPPENVITRLDPHEIHQLRSGFSRRRSKSTKQNKSQVKQLREEDCLFEFATVDEINHSKVGMHDGSLSPTRRHGALHVHIVEADGLPHMDLKGDTDGYVVLEMEGVDYRSSVVPDSIQPEWNDACSFSVFDKTSHLIVSVFDEDSHHNDDIIGKITLDISELEENQPQDVWKEIVAVKSSPGKSQWSGAKTGLGRVRLVLAWANAENAEVLLQKWTEDDIENNRVREESTMWRFRAPSPEVKYSWLQAIAWVERGCEGRKPPRIAAPNICEEDTKEVQNNPSVVDLPIAKCRHLLYNLREFECLGLKEGRDANLYATFQLELHAWKTAYHKDRRKRNSGGGASIDAFHGLDFHLTLQRLCLLRYGKSHSLSYDELMEEYERERAHVALHVIQSCILAWAYVRRGERADRHHMIHHMWKKGHEENGELLGCYFDAVDGIRRLRLRVLHRLRKLVEKQNPDFWHGKWDPSKVKQTREEKRRQKKIEKEEAKQLRKERKDKEFNERHDREKLAQQARADDVLALRRSGRHNAHFENPVLWSDEDEENDEGGAASPGKISRAHLAPRTALVAARTVASIDTRKSSFESDVPSSFDIEEMRQGDESPIQIYSDEDSDEDN